MNSVCQSAACTSYSYPGRLALGWSKCATRALACKLHLGNPTCALGARSQLITNHESTRPRSASVLKCYRRLSRGSYNCLPKLTTCLAAPDLRCNDVFRAALLEDSNLVDPASSHMLVSKTNSCMSKYKFYTAKLRMAH